jgi:hypothetical protein
MSEAAVIGWHRRRGHARSGPLGRFKRPQAWKPEQTRIVRR